jgi:hypothetical protein
MEFLAGVRSRVWLKIPKIRFFGLDEGLVWGYEERRGLRGQ